MWINYEKPTGSKGNIEDLYQTNIRPLSVAKRLKLASMILTEITGEKN